MKGACAPLTGSGGPLDGGLPDGGAGGPLPLALHAVRPALAQVGSDVTLEGAFSGSVRVLFPEAEPVVVNAGARTTRLVVTVPSGASAGALAVEQDGERSGPVPFRATRFVPRLGASLPHMEQDVAARELPSLLAPRAGHIAVARRPYLYVVGGRNAAGTTSTVERARVYADDSLGPFRAAGTGLLHPREDAAFAVVGRHLYVIGGASLGAPRADLEVATFDDEGNLGAFAAAEAGLTVPRAGAAAIVLGRYLYVVGGRSADEELASVERAPIRSDGSLGPFEAVPASLTAPRRGPALVVVDAFLHVIGGGEQDPAGIERVKVASSGELVEGFARVAELPEPRSLHSAVRVGDEVCVLGGRVGGPSSATPATSTACAHVLASPPLGLFIPDPRALSGSRAAHALAVVGDRLYAIGGEGAGPTGRLEQARLDAGAELSGFTLLTERALLTPRRAASCAVIGDWLYVVGGYDGQSDLRAIERALVAEDGSLGAFELHRELGSARRAMRLAVLRDRVYAVGGAQSGSRLTAVSSTRVLEDGSLASNFTNHSTLGTARMGSALAVVGEHLYAVGGRDADGDERSTERAFIEAGGLQASWSPGPDLVSPRSFHAVITLDERLYVVGGRDGDNFWSTIEEAAFVADVRTARIDGFSSFGSFTAGRATHNVLAAGGALWLVGGATDQSQVTTVERAPVGADGHLTSAFIAMGEPVPADVASNGCLVRVGGYVYLIGGAGDLTGAPSSTVYRAVLE